MQIVRTIGQAFEVCHRISVQAADQNEEAIEGGSEKSLDEVEPAVAHSEFNRDISRFTQYRHKFIDLLPVLTPAIQNKHFIIIVLSIMGIKCTQIYLSGMLVSHTRPKCKVYVYKLGSSVKMSPF